MIFELDEGIKWVEEAAERYYRLAGEFYVDREEQVRRTNENEEIAEHFSQLSKWLMELKERRCEANGKLNFTEDEYGIFLAAISRERCVYKDKKAIPTEDYQRVMQRIRMCDSIEAKVKALM